MNVMMRDVGDGENAHETNLFNDLLFFIWLSRTFISTIKGQSCTKGSDVVELSELGEGKV